MSSRVLDKGYWREPLDLTISMTYGGQFFKHLHQHIHPVKLTTSEASFYRYAKLPAELQVRVLQQCDAPTLFQLMHTSRCLRTDAKKLFFSDQKTWYRLHAETLLDCGFPGESMYDIDFLASIEQLYLECQITLKIWLPEKAWETPGSDEEVIELFDEHVNAGIKEFWQTVQRLCPQVKRVMLSKDGGSVHDKHPVTDCYRKLAQVCPRGIDVFLYAAETEKEAAGRRRRRVCWRMKTGQEATDTMVTPKWEEHPRVPKVIVVPPEKPYRGHVGAFIKSHSLWAKYNDQRFAAEMHRAAAIEKYYFEGRHEPFGCSVTDCGAWFEQPEQYTTHLLATGHGPGEAAPEGVEALFTENTKRIQRLRQDQQEAHRYFWDWWGEWGTEQRSMAEKEMLDQLEHDALYTQDKAVAEHGLLLLIHKVEMELSYC